ncbi:MAG: LysM peptidoglycan-binding domain-containing protein [Chloroflexi bacterium]|nr:MAG: LysM peptidoglycan-binding domain-containing protein [Chloroflexota bacterium]
MARKNKSILHLCLILFVVTICTGKPETAVAQPAPALEILQLVNSFRVTNGLPPFQLNSALTIAAQTHADWMAANIIFDQHVEDNGSTPQSRAAAAGYVGRVVENIVGGTGMTPHQGLIWWQNSPVHYNTLVTTRYIEAGVGYASNGGANFYVLLVGVPADHPGAPPPNTTNDSPEPLFITPIELAQPREDGSIVHVVQPGQALWSIAAYYEVPLSELLLINNLTPDSFIKPGDEIIVRLPDGASLPPTPTPPLTHVVQEGESLWSIAARYNLKLADLLWFNNLTEDAILRPGDELMIRLAPGQSPPPTPTPILTHVVRAGQTLWDIALTYGLSLDELLAYNGLSAEAIIRPGDVLFVRPPVPTAVSEMSPTVTPIPQPSPTPSPTFTPVPTEATMSVRSETETAVSPTPTPIPETGNALITWGGTLLLIGLMILVGAIYFLRRNL